jgi:hypothetical protein
MCSLEVALVIGVGFEGGFWYQSCHGPLFQEVAALGKHVSHFCESEWFHMQ